MCGRGQSLASPWVINLQRQMLSRAQTSVAYNSCSQIHIKEHSFFFLNRLIVYSSTYWQRREGNDTSKDQGDIFMTNCLIDGVFAPLPYHNLQLLICAFFPLSFSCRWSWSTRYQFLMQHLQCWTGGDRWCDVGGPSEKFPESWTLMNSK